MLSRNWTNDRLLFSWHTGALEDFAVVKNGKTYFAFFTAGKDLQNQRLYRSFAEGPLGPFSEPELVSNRETHTRLYRSLLEAGPLKGDMIISAVWPGLPKCGMWHFRPIIGTPLMEKQLLIAPTPNTLFDVAAANPCTFWDGEHYNIFFEGRTDPARDPRNSVDAHAGTVPRAEMFWRNFHATWDGINTPQIDVKPLHDGANPSIVRGEDKIYLYYSKLRGAGKYGFETWVCEQERW